MSGDDAVRATNDDATACKREAVGAGYWQDNYIQYFMKGPSQYQYRERRDRKTPEIYRGYYARVVGMRRLLKQFLEVWSFVHLFNYDTNTKSTYLHTKTVQHSTLDNTVLS